jgi:hypothetical protein
MNDYLSAGQHSFVGGHRCMLQDRKPPVAVARNNWGDKRHDLPANVKSNVLKGSGKPYINVDNISEPIIRISTLPHLQFFRLSDCFARQQT